MSPGRPDAAHGRVRWTIVFRVGAILILAAAAFLVALRLPIQTPTGSPAAYAAGEPEAGTAVPTAVVPAVPTAGVPAVPTAGAPPAPPEVASSEPTLASASAAPSRSAVAPTTSARPPTSATPCQPARFSWLELGINASVVRLALTPNGDLGTPRDADKTRAGWFPSVLAGSPQGTVLMDGHTYHDDSALFKMTFERQVRTGMVMRLSCADGHAFSYRISEVALDLTPASFRAFVDQRSLYAADGPPQLVMITCTDYDAARRVWKHRAVLVATPVP